MIAERLRKSILQAAIQGKLTEQLPEDGDARDLLATIQSAKEKLIKNGSLKKDKVIHKISEDDKVFEIPENWCWVDLGDIFDIARGGSPRPIQAFLTTKEDGINWIKIGDTDIGGKYIDQTKEKIIPEGIKKSRVVNPGDLLLTNSMSFGRPYILNTRGCIHDGWLVLSPLSDGINREYFYYLLSSEFVRMAFAGTVAGAVVKNLNSDKVRVVTVPLPTLLEQKRIVSKIEELLQYIEELEKDETKLDIIQKSFPKKMKDSLLQSAIQGKLTEQLETDGDARDLVAEIQKEKARLIKEGKIKQEKDLPDIIEDEIPFDIPDNWCWVRLKNISKSISAGGDKPEQFSKTKTTKLNIPVVSNGKKDDGIFGYTDIATINEKSVTVSGRGTIGYSCVRDYPFCPIVRLITVIPSDLVSPKYLELVLTALLENGVGTSIQQLTVPMVSPKVIPLPPLAEQQRIVEKLDQLLLLCDALE